MRKPPIRAPLDCFGRLTDTILQMMDQLIDKALKKKSKNFSFVIAHDEVICHLRSGIKNYQLQLFTVIKRPLKRCQSAGKIWVSSPC